MLAVLLWFGAQALLRSPSQAIAVLEFRALEANLQGFTAGLADRLMGAMSTNDLQAAHTTAAADADRIAAAAATGAAFILDGTVRPDGAEVHVTARLIDLRGNVVVWSSEYRRSAAEQTYMQEQVAADVTHVLRCALLGVRDGARRIDTATLGVFLRACDGMDDIYSNPEETQQVLRQVTERAPRFSRGWSMRGASAATLASWTSGEESEQFKAEAEHAAETARRLDPSNAEPYLIEASLLPPRDLRRRQALIDRALEIEPNLAAAHAEQAGFYLDIGRNQDALAAARRAVALEPLNADYWAMMTPALSALDDISGSAELHERLYRIWPNAPDAWLGRFWNATFVGDPARALRMLDDRGPVPFEPAAESRWRAFLAARRSGDPARVLAAAHGLRSLIPGRAGRVPVAAALAYAGDVDGAIDVISPVLADPAFLPTSFFLPPWTNLRRDPRFLSLIRDTGLIEYWRETGRWPDFCRADDLPYECEAEAARLLAAPGER